MMNDTERMAAAIEELKQAQDRVARYERTIEEVLDILEALHKRGVVLPKIKRVLAAALDGDEAYQARIAAEDEKRREESRRLSEESERMRKRVEDDDRNRFRPGVRPKPKIEREKPLDLPRYRPLVRD